MSSQKAHFIFTQHANSFSVHIVNLEKLSVEDIQKIELFVSQRKGVFDFQTYTFVIQKKLNFEEFKTLVQHSAIESVSEEKIVINTTDEKIDFGKYKGMRISDLPKSYLVWMKANYRGPQRELIEQELQRRNI